MTNVPSALSSFAHVTVLDFEFVASKGERPKPICMVARELRSGTSTRLWRDELLRSPCPFPVGTTDVVIAYYASAEWGCMLELGWALPVHVLDLYAEHRVETNGPYLATGNGLLGALAMRGLTRIDVAKKDAMRNKILTSIKWTPESQAEVLDYCSSDVDALADLLQAMGPTMDVPRALLRGRYTKAVARIEREGVPIDRNLHSNIVAAWQGIRKDLVRDLDRPYGVYRELEFRRPLFSDWLRKNSIPWPRTDTGVLRLDDETFKEQSLIWPAVRPLRDLRNALGRMYLSDLQIGSDGRCRTMLSPFASKTGRNQPSGKRFVFSLSSWQRGIVRPPAGWAIGYVDFSSQEIAVAAGLSGDAQLVAAYESGDPYLAFGKRAGMIPGDGTAESHHDARAICKSIVLGLNYGLGAEGMAYQAGITPAVANELIERHHGAYPRYWRWLRDVMDAALITNEMASIFGWKRKLTEHDRPTSLMNFPMQANGAEMMRIASIAATEAGIQVCAPIHDAFLIASPTANIDDAVRDMRSLMSQAGQSITGGINVRTDAKIFRYPQRYMDERGVDMWNRVMTLIGRDDVLHGGFA